MTAPLPRLTRATHGRPAAPVRIVHVGVGNFFRAHQAWYTDRAPDANRWGIAAFTGRSASMAEALAPQDGLYTLITRGAGGDSFDVVGSISAVHAASDTDAWLGYLRSPEVAIVTLTVTEAGYRPGPGCVAERLVAGLRARREAGAGALAIVSCDNLSGNGAVLARAVREAASDDPDLLAWIDAHVAFGTTMVDRITPATTDEHRELVADALGVRDAAPVPTEPFSEWVIQGEFPAGRPAWDAVGARIVDDVTPYETRKLLLLNGSHSLLAYAGSMLGHATVADAIADPRCRAWVEDWWDVAGPHVPLSASEVSGYRAALLERFANPNIRHLLAQIAHDGSLKLPVRIVPVVRAEREAGRLPVGGVRALAAWTLHLRGLGAPVRDAQADAIAGFGEGSLEESVDKVLNCLGLAGDSDLAAAVAASARELMAEGAK